MGIRRSSILMIFFIAAALASDTTGFVRAQSPEAQSEPTVEPSVEGICPPFHLLDESGAIIDPLHGVNDDRPYSPKQTCGRCHDYEKITQGYHFTQGAGERPTPEQAARCRWALTPGNYGGTWCSPAPLYRYLSPKQNSSSATMDMTSFTFITAGCGECHPGGGPLEFDREGHRYDVWMEDPRSGFTPGGENAFDGDYYQARWSESGVLEADCMLCHMPEYDFDARNKQIAALNFRWAATAGAGLAEVAGSVQDGDVPRVRYERGRFDAEGKVAVHIVKEPRNETCLACHAKPGWKKRGANFRPRTDVHLRAGLKCVDCHPAGSAADDPRIRGKEEHHGDLEMMGYDDKPARFFRPVLAEYNGKIYPVNRVHSAWPGIEVEGRPGLMQPRMGDIYGMWSAHREDPGRYPGLAAITDDNGDLVPEVNRPEEIDALIAAVSQRLTDVGYPMTDSRVVWVSNERVYSTGGRYRTLEKEEWEASPYGNVHKYSHDVYPARAALGVNGCSDCHRGDSPFFFASVVARPFDEEAQTVTVAQHEAMGYTGKPREYSGPASAVAGLFRVFAVVVFAGLMGHMILDFLVRKCLPPEESPPIPEEGRAAETVQRFNTHCLAQHLTLMISVSLLILSALFLWGLRYPGAQWAGALTGAMGGVDTWRVVHRLGAGLLMITCFYHVIYSLVHPEGRRDYRLLLPRGRDFRDFGANLKRFVGLRKQSPRFGRFTYFEKFDYWAVFWGCVIMIGSGLAMWFPGGVARVLPGVSGGFLDALKEAHAHEALLAAAAILV